MKKYRKFLRRATGATAIAVSALMVVTACSGGGADDSSTSTDVEEKDGALYIDGELIADKDLWAAAQEEGSIQVYSTYSEVLELALQDQFTEDTGITVQNLRLTGNRMYERIESENASGNLQADVIRRSDLALVKHHDESGVFAEFCPLAWDELIRTKDPNCHFWASNETPYVIGYNSEMISESDAPESWDDLLKPAFKGKLGINNIASGGTTWSRSSWLRETKGVEYWEQMAAQDPHISTSAASITDLMARGEIAAASVLIGPQSGAIDNGAPLEIVMPSDGVPTSAHYLGLTTSAKNTNAAKVFLNWSASLAGQTAMAVLAGDYAVRDDAPAPEASGVTLPARSEVDLIFTENIEESDADKNREAWIADWMQIFNYTPE